MIQLFKDRNFNDYLNDTFNFFKVLGKHFFKNYFAINGGFLLITTVLMYLFSKVYFEMVFSKISRGRVPNSYLENLTQTNPALIVTGFCFLFLLFTFFAILQFTFPVIYLDLYDRKKGIDFTAKDIITGIKDKIPKILKFILGSIFILFPIFLIVFILNILLCFIIIGIPLFLVTIPAMISLMHLTFYFYLNSNQGFFKALSDSFETLKEQFWAIVFSTLIVFIIYYFINAIFTLIPYLFGMASVFTSLKNPDPSESFSGISIMISIVMVISTLTSFILNNLVLVNQGMIYYSNVENEDSKQFNNPIDLIGTDSE